MAPHSSTLAWKIPWTEEPGGLQSMGSLRVRHDWVTHFHFSLSCIGEGNGNPLQCSCLENPRNGGDWWFAVYGVAQSQTRLKYLSSSSSSIFKKIMETVYKRGNFLEAEDNYVLCSSFRSRVKTKTFKFTSALWLYIPMKFVWNILSFRPNEIPLCEINGERKKKVLLNERG